MTLLVFLPNKWNSWVVNLLINFNFNVDELRVAVPIVKMEEAAPKNA